jgi:predicted NBD/HSP70 family sugar kinase
MASKKRLLWGVDLGGTKIECAVLDVADLLNPICRKRISTESEKGYEHIVSRIDELISSVKAETKETPELIGFGTPGVLDPKLGMMKNCNTVCLNGKPLHSDLAKKLGVPVRLSNDANCFALAEALMGAGLGAQSAFGVIMGTGVGGGVVIGGKAIDGLQGIAGEWGHNVLEPTGPDCYCGKKGCVERIISGPATQDFYASRTGKKATLQEIHQAYLSGKDSAAVETIERLTSYFGRAITVVINILDPEVVVLGGGVSNIPELYTLGIEEAKRNVFNNRLETRIVKNKLGDSAGVFGAALLSK